MNMNEMNDFEFASYLNLTFSWRSEADETTYPNWKLHRMKPLIFPSLFILVSARIIQIEEVEFGFCCKYF